MARRDRPSPGPLDTGAQHTAIPTLVGEVCGQLR